LKLITLRENVLKGKSPPARGRGLKRDPYWWGVVILWSPPARGRGLKLFLLYYEPCPGMSPPARGRGLKPPVPSV